MIAIVFPALSSSAGERKGVKGKGAGNKLRAESAPHLPRFSPSSRFALFAVLADILSLDFLNQVSFAFEA